MMGRNHLQWIWVRGSEPKSKDRAVEKAIEEAAELLKKVTEKVEAIKNDASIPVRSSKKTGAKSKKEVREQVQAEATESLKEIAVRHGYVSGKWLIFASPGKVDTIWTSLATSLASGPLASTSARLAKVATSPAEDSPNYQHIICVYVPDVYDKVEVTEIMRIMLRNHGVSLSGVKSNLYTSLRIDSKHASGIPSTTWKNSALMDDKESKELKDAFFAELASTKPAASDKPKSAVKSDEAAPAGKAKPKLKKKAADDPFASDDDDDAKADAGEEKRKEAIQAKTAKGKPQPKKKVVDDTFGSDDDDAEEEAKRKSEVSKKKSKAVSRSKKRQISESDEGDVEEEEDRPKKRRSGR
ncbi:hypothetical protein DXG03_001472 [Asterophora parasitica]|uniref:Uncharacterized protein n=1 Tax=Asterophora parasitica TaxID=117018 RepID=A0A9P7KGR6_9AGAR|nr:hypothetical protein DXG03_001472 [Asterophora parasitica]